MTWEDRLLTSFFYLIFGFGLGYLLVSIIRDRR